MDDAICMPVIVVHACLYPGEYSGQGRAGGRGARAGRGGRRTALSRCGPVYGPGRWRAGAGGFTA